MVKIGHCALKSAFASPGVSTLDIKPRVISQCDVNGVIGIFDGTIEVAF